MNRISAAARLRALLPLVALVTLSACQCSYTVTPTAAPMPAAGSTIAVNVTTRSSCSWTSQAHDAWITVGPDPDNTGQTGKGNGRVLVTAAANGSTTSRTGTATVAGQTITINQAGTGSTACTFQVSPAQLAFTGGAAGSGQFTITASATNCGWHASRSSNLEDTVNLTSGGNGGSANGEDRFGVGSTTITYQVKANSSTSPWPTGGGDIVVRDAAQQVAATHHVALQ
jgi:hypothetical protein